MFSLWLVFFDIFHFVDFVFCHLFVNTTFCSFTWFCVLFISCHLWLRNHFTLILFKAFFYSKVVNNWRRSLTKTFLLNFLSFFMSEVVHPHIFLLSTFVFAVRFGLWVFIDPPGAVHLRSSNNFMYIYIYIYNMCEVKWSYLNVTFQLIQHFDITFWLSSYILIWCIWDGMRLGWVGMRLEGGSEKSFGWGSRVKYNCH